MSFNVIALGGDSALSDCFFHRAEDASFRVVGASALQAYDELSLAFEHYTPSIVLHLGEFDSGERESAEFDASLGYCEAENIPFILLSSYRVFGDLAAHQTISEEEHQALLADNFHAEREKKVRALAKHIILRRSWLLDGEDGLLPLLAPLLLSKVRAMVVSDHHYGCPLSISAVVDYIFAMLLQVLMKAENWGTFHIHSADACSEAEFCDHLVRQLQKELELDIALPPVATQDDTRRCLTGNAYLRGRRCTDNFGIQMPTWRRGFGRVLRAWLRDNGHLDSSI